MSIENSMESTPASWKLQTWIFSSPHSHTCRRIVVAHIWSCDTERRNSKYRLRFLAVAADNLGLNRRQLSASVAWHPVLGGVLVFHLLLYITMFFIYFASDSQHTKDAFQDCPPPPLTLPQWVSQLWMYVITFISISCCERHESLGKFILFFSACGHIECKLPKHLTLKHTWWITCMFPQWQQFDSVIVTDEDVFIY